MQKEGVIASDSRIVEKRTVTPQQYAEKISIYHNVKSLSATYSQVSIGDQKGIINLNGDLILPIEKRDGSFRGISSSILALEGNRTIQYYNLNTSEKITLNKNDNGFIKDKNNPEKLHYFNPKNWSIKNEYINRKGETKTFDYAEILDQSHLSHIIPNCKFYILHQVNGLSLYLINRGKNLSREYRLHLEGIEIIGKLTETNMGKLFLPIKLLNGKKLNLEIGTLDNYKHYIISDFDKPDSFWDKWLTATEEENPFEKKREEERKKREEEERKEIQKREKEKRIEQQKEEEKRKRLKKLKLKRNIAKLFLCIAIITTILSWVIIFSGSESYLGGFELIWGLIGGPALGMISGAHAFTPHR